MSGPVKFPNLVPDVSPKREEENYEAFELATKVIGPALQIPTRYLDGRGRTQMMAAFYYADPTDASFGLWQKPLYDQCTVTGRMVARFYLPQEFWGETAPSPEQIGRLQSNGAALKAVVLPARAASAGLRSLFDVVTFIKSVEHDKPLDASIALTDGASNILSVAETVTYYVGWRAYAEASVGATGEAMFDAAQLNKSEKFFSATQRIARVGNGLMFVSGILRLSREAYAYTSTGDYDGTNAMFGISETGQAAFGFTAAQYMLNEASRSTNSLQGVRALTYTSPAGYPRWLMWFGRGAGAIGGVVGVVISVRKFCDVAEDPRLSDDQRHLQETSWALFGAGSALTAAGAVFFTVASAPVLTVLFIGGAVCYVAHGIIEYFFVDDEEELIEAEE